MSVENQTTTKVLFITHNYIRFSGDFAGVFLHLLARKLLDKGVQVSVIAPHDAGLAEEETIDGIKIYRFRYGDDDAETFAYRGDMHNQLFKNPFKIFMLRKFLNESYKLACKVIDKEDVDIVSIHWLIPNGYVAKKLLKKYRKRLRLFISSHGSDIRILTKLKFVYRYLRKTVRRCKKYTVVSSHLKKQLTALDRGLADKIKVMPLPNDETLFYPDNSFPEDKNLVLAVTRLTVQKRVDNLLKAIKIASVEAPNIKLEIYGDGPERERLNGLIEQLGLEGRVSMHGAVPQRDLRRVYNRAAMVILNSVEEGFGLALTEAMLCKKAVIGTDSGGIPDIIDHDETGLLVPADDEQALAEAVVRLLHDEEGRERMAEAGYQKATSRFSSDATAAAFAEMYRQE